MIHFVTYKKMKKLFFACLIVPLIIGAGGVLAAPLHRVSGIFPVAVDSLPDLNGYNRNAMDKYIRAVRRAMEEMMAAQGLETGTNPAVLSVNAAQDTPPSTPQDTLPPPVVSVDETGPLDARERRAYEKYAKQKSCKKCANGVVCKKCADRKKRAAQRRAEEAEKDDKRTQSMRYRRRSAADRAFCAYGQVPLRPHLAYLSPYLSARAVCAYQPRVYCKRARRRARRSIPNWHRPYRHHASE